ncbi:MAG TPA: peptide-methionine (R)-S-oxide reductase MsrB [Nitrospiria bacterium]
MTRRTFMAALAGLIAASLPIRKGFAMSDSSPKAIEKITKSDAEWRRLLAPEQYHVLREAGTEQAFSSPLNDIKKKGVYACAGCELELFTSDMKFDSGTGWPSFFTSIEGRLNTKLDFKLLYPRTEYHCARCDGHQGHVFKDGPPPTGQRWCNNGLALKFIAS